MSKRILYENIQTKEKLDEYKELFRSVVLTWNALKSIPKIKHFEELYLKAVKRDGFALLYVPGEKRTEEICLEAVKQNGYALQYIPEEKKTTKVCLEAVKQNGHALQLVPREKITEALCVEAVKRTEGGVYHVSKELKRFILEKLNKYSQKG
jgi:hypothetical protein